MAQSPKHCSYSIAVSRCTVPPSLEASLVAISLAPCNFEWCHFTAISNLCDWRQIWRVAGRESGSPELLESPWTSPEVPRTSPEVFGDFPGSSLTVELNSNPGVPRKSPRLPRKFPGLPRRFPDFPGGQPFLWEA